MEFEYKHVFMPTCKFDELLIKSMKQKYQQKLRVEKQLKNSDIIISCGYSTKLNYIFYN